MSLKVISTPIGNPKDISLRALEVLNDLKFIIGEEPKTCRQVLSSFKISPREKELFFLNEHTKKEELNELVDLCLKEDVGLITDCGTPGFCDPGADLVQLCKAKSIEVEVLPGASSLMTFISYLGERWDSFIFLGFPPRDKEPREKFFENLNTHNYPVFFLEAPYRLTQTLENLKTVLGTHKIHFGSNLTAPDQEIYFDTADNLLKKVKNKKAPFIVGYKK
jgi:16S rRNA (cytidine1402-2'-O)-methyltransferase